MSRATITVQPTQSRSPGGADCRYRCRHRGRDEPAASIVTAVALVDYGRGGPASQPAHWLATGNVVCRCRVGGSASDVLKLWSSVVSPARLLVRRTGECSLFWEV